VSEFEISCVQVRERLRQSYQSRFGEKRISGIFGLFDEQTSSVIGKRLATVCILANAIAGCGKRRMSFLII